MGREHSLGCQRVAIDRFTRLVNTIYPHGVIAAEVHQQFINHWVFSYGPPIDRIAEKGSKFSSMFFQDVKRSSTCKNFHEDLTPADYCDKWKDLIRLYCLLFPPTSLTILEIGTSTRKP